MLTFSNTGNVYRIFVLFFCIIIPTPDAHAENTPGNSQYNNLTIRAGAFVIRNANTDIRVDDPLLGTGIVIDLDKTLDMDSSSDSPRLDIRAQKLGIDALSAEGIVDPDDVSSFVIGLYDRRLPIG